MASDQMTTDLYNASLQGNWSAVIDMYKRYSWARTGKFHVANGQTALHLAVLEAGDEEFRLLMETIPEPELPKVVNYDGDTPLHLAASRGLLKKCQFIKPFAKTWFSHRNSNSETPLFLAALHGHEDVFLYLHQCDTDASLCTRTTDGSTVLHVTIDREYFGLAYTIMHIYDAKLVDKNNADGETPLQLLANKPSAFRSTTHLQWWKSIIYHTIAIDPLNFVPKTEFEDPEADNEREATVPENYTTWRDFYVMLKNILNKRNNKGTKNKDNQEEQAGNQDLKGQLQEVNDALRSKYTFPPSYATCLDFLSRSFVYILGQSGFGDEFRRIKERKERHVWSFLIMEKLLMKSVTSSTTGGGGQPYSVVLDPDDDAITDQSGESLLISPPTFDLDEPPEIEHGEKNDDKLTRSSKTTSDSSDLLTAVKGGAKELMEKILELEKKEKLQGSASKTTLDSSVLIAAKNGAKELIDKILEAEEKYDHQKHRNTSETTTGDWPLLTAAKRGVLELIDKILEVEKKEERQHSGVSTTMSDSSLLIEVKRGMEELIGQILEQVEKKEKQYSSPSKKTRGSPMLIAAKNGVVELVDKLLDVTPVAVHELTADKKNVLLVAVENRHTKIFQRFLKEKNIFQRLVQTVDDNGNTVLHYAAVSSGRQPWRIPGAALQMQWEIKWYEYVKKQVPVHFVFRANRSGKSPAAIFNEDHKDLVRDGGAWLKDTAESCSVVAALIATVAFATAVQVPGGNNQEDGKPIFEGRPAFNLFAIASLVSLCFSVTALIMFLAILTSRYQTRDFRRDLPLKLFLGMSSLLVSIASVLVSFCAGHFFEVEDRFGRAIFPVYFVTCLPITFYAVAQFPLYIDLWKAINVDVPQPSRALEDF